MSARMRMRITTEARHLSDLDLAFKVRGWGLEELGPYSNASITQDMDRRLLIARLAERVKAHFDSAEALDELVTYLRTPLPSER